MKSRPCCSVADRSSDGVNGPRWASEHCFPALFSFDSPAAGFAYQRTAGSFGSCTSGTTSSCCCVAELVAERTSSADTAVAASSVDSARWPRSSRCCLTSAQSQS